MSILNFDDKREHHRIWLLALIVPVGGRAQRLISAALIMGLVWVALNAFGGAMTDYENLFFASVIAYSITIFSRIIAQSLAAFDEVRSALDLPNDQLEEMRLRLSHRTTRWTVLAFVCAITMGLLHVFLIQMSSGSSFLAVLQSQENYVTNICTIATWIVLTTNIAALVGNALVWSAIGRSMNLDLLMPKAARVVGRTAVKSMLSVIGAQVLFVILIYGGGWDWVSVFPGLVAGSAPALLLFIIPVWPLHRRLKSAKLAMLHSVENDLAALGPLNESIGKNTARLDQLNRLLILRNEIHQVSTWPFDGSNLFRFGFYLLLPPLTWVGAALVENVVDLFLD